MPCLTELNRHPHRCMIQGMGFGFRISALVTIAMLMGQSASAQRGSMVSIIDRASVGAIATDRDGTVYLTGFTGSTLFETTPDALKRVCDSGGQCFSDAFVVKLDRTGRRLYATYLGG